MPGVLRRFPTLLIVASVLVSVSCATSAERLVGRDDLARDARRVERVLRRAHPAVGRTASAAALSTTLDALLADLPDSATATEFARRVRPLLDTLRGGHVGIYPRGLRARALLNRPTSAFPLSPKRLTDGRVIVAGVAPHLDSTLLGQELIAVDGEPVGAIVAEAALFGGGSDGPNVSGVEERAVRRLGGHLAWRDGPRDTFHVELRRAVADGSDSAYAIALPTYRPSDHPDAKRRSRARRRAWRPIAYGFDTARRVAVIDVNSFSGYDPLNYRWPVALRRVFRMARRDGAHALVLDLRGNGGGRSANIATLLRQVVTEPTQIYAPWTMPRSGWRAASAMNKALLAPSVVLGRDSTARFGRWMRHRIKPRRDGFRGPVIVLVDGGTFSAAAAVAAVLKSSGRALLAGQEAGGNYHETYAGLFTTVPLRGTGLRLRVPHLVIPLAVDAERQSFGESLQPDVTWPVTREAVVNGTDEVLLRALEWAGAQR